MGCDIHLTLECKRKGNARWERCGIFGYNQTWGDRVYGMFAALAGVRNYTDMESMTPRGIPHDATRHTLLLYGYEVVKDDVKYYDWQISETQAEGWTSDGFSEYLYSDGIRYCSSPDNHTPSWVTPSEMEDCINRVFRDADGIYKGDYIEWLALLGAMKGYEQAGVECRAVFWFDN